MGLVQAGRARLTGSFDIQLNSLDFSAIGAHAFVRPSALKQYANVTSLHYQTEARTFEHGLRFDRTENRCELLPSERRPGLIVTLVCLVRPLAAAHTGDTFWGIEAFTSQQHHG